MSAGLRLSTIEKETLDRARSRLALKGVVVSEARLLQILVTAAGRISEESLERLVRENAASSGETGASATGD